MAESQTPDLTVVIVTATLAQRDNPAVLQTELSAYKAKSIAEAVGLFVVGCRDKCPDHNIVSGPEWMLPAQLPWPEKKADEAPAE